MISPDTNILARAILEDDAKQSPIAQAFLEQHTKAGNLYISPYMILELAWLLKSKGFERHEISPILEKLIHANGVNVGQKSILISALNLYAKNNISFTDCLISSDSKMTANANTSTFDLAFQKADSYCVSPSETMTKIFN